MPSVRTVLHREKKSYDEDECYTYNDNQYGLQLACLFCKCVIKPVSYCIKWNVYILMWFIALRYSGKNMVVNTTSKLYPSICVNIHLFLIVLFFIPLANSFISSSTISFTNSSKVVVACHPKISLALVGFPFKISTSFCRVNKQLESRYKLHTCRPKIAWINFN